MAQLTYRDAVAAGIAQEMRRDPNVVLLGEDVAAAGGVFKATVGPARRVRPEARQGHADLGASDRRRRDGRRDDGAAPHRRLDVLRLLRGHVGHRREPDREDALHDGRPGHAAARDPLRERRRLALRRAALSKRRELVHDDSGLEDRRAGLPRRRQGPARRGHPQRRPRDVLRAEVAVRHERRSARRRARHRARQGERACAKART